MQPRLQVIDYQRNMVPGGPLRYRFRGLTAMRRKYSALDAIHRGETDLHDRQDHARAKARRKAQRAQRRLARR